MKDTDLVKDIKHLMEERDYALEHLKDILEMNFSEEKAREQLERILKQNKELKLLEDQLVLYRVTKAQQKK